MPARIIRPPCTRYQSECRLTVSRMASRITWAATSSGMVMVRLLHPSEGVGAPMGAASWLRPPPGGYRVSRGNVARDPEKWEPVFGKDHAQNKNLERNDDSKRNHPALGVAKCDSKALLSRCDPPCCCNRSGVLRWAIVRCRSSEEPLEAGH